MTFTLIDRLTIAFGGLLTLVGIARWAAIAEKRSVLLVALAGLLPFVVASLRRRTPNAPPWVLLAFEFQVIASILLIFDNLGPLIRAVHPVDRDAWLIDADRFLFGFDPTVWASRFASPLLSDVLTVSYALYYFHPIVLGGLLYRDEGRARGTGRTPVFQRFGFKIVAAFYFSYLGYFALPAIGPRFTVAHPEPLPRGTISRVIDQTLDRLETNKRNCFPSGHTMITTVVLIEAFRRSRKTFLGFLPFALGLFAATVYGRYHYAIDVLAGFALAFAFVPAIDALFDRLMSWQRRTEGAPPPNEPLQATARETSL